MQFSVEVRNNRLDSIETTISTAPRLRLRTGAPPANCAASRTGDVLATLVLPSDWMANASNGSKAKAGTWEIESAEGDGGVAGHFEIMDSSLTTCHIQGTVSMPAADPLGDMILDNTSIANGQRVTVQSFTITDGNA